MSSSTWRHKSIVQLIIGVVCTFVLSGLIVACIREDNKDADRYDNCILGGNEVVSITHGYVCRDRDGTIIDKWSM